VFFNNSINVEANTKYRWYKNKRTNIEYITKDHCDFLVDESDSHKELLYEEDHELIYDDDNIIEEVGTKVLTRDVTKIKYIGLDNVTTNNNVLILTKFEIYNNNELIQSHYFDSNNTGDTSFFINNKSFLELFNNGYVILELDEEIDLNDLKIELRLGNSFEIKDALLFMGDDLNNYAYYKHLDNTTNTLSQHYLSSFTLDNTYVETVYRYYEIDYMCYKEEREYLDGYYDYVEGYIKDENDFINENEEPPFDEGKYEEGPKNIIQDIRKTVITKVMNHNYKSNKKNIYNNR